MPRYDYFCNNCRKKIELEKSMDSPHPVFCPHCGAKGLRRVFNPPSFRIRGEHLITSRPKAVPPVGMTIQPRSS